MTEEPQSPMTIWIITAIIVIIIICLIIYLGYIIVEDMKQFVVEIDLINQTWQAMGGKLNGT